MLRPGGIGLITVREGAGEGLREKDDKSITDKRYFANYTAEEFAKILEKNSFSVIETSSRSGGDKYVWLSFFVQVA